MLGMTFFAMLLRAAQDSASIRSSPSWREPNGLLCCIFRDEVVTKTNNREDLGKMAYRCTAENRSDVVCLYPDYLYRGSL